DLIVGHGMCQLVGARRLSQIDVQKYVELETLPDLGFVRHHPVIGVQRQPGHENRVAHVASRMASAMRKACTVSATSWVRTIAAPLITASTWAAIEPPSRSPGSDGTMEAINRLRETPTS